MAQQYFIKGVTQDWLLKPGMVVYVESVYDASMNLTISNNHDTISEICGIQGLTFLYIPKFYKSCGLEVLEYMTGKSQDYPSTECTSYVLKSLLSSSVIGQIHGPTLLYTGLEDDKLVAYQLATSGETNTSDSDEVYLLAEFFEVLLHTYNNYRNPSQKKSFVNSGTRFRVKETDDSMGIKFSLRGKNKPTEYYAANNDEELCRKRRETYPSVLAEEAPQMSVDTDTEIEEIKNSYTFNIAQAMIHSLLKKGYSKETIWALFEPIQELSPIHITKDYRIFLTLYQKEIVLTPLLKAVYLFFLKHPEGVYFKDLPSYHAELLQLYRKFALRGTVEKHISIITDLVNPLGNSINEKCSIIKKYMTNLLDDSLAKHYYISGGKGELKRIAIKHEMIVWE